MTLLIGVEQNANALPPLMSAFRHDFANKLRHNAVALGTETHPFKMIGAFEVDLKNMASQSDASLASQELVKQLGYNPKIFKSQYLLHLHAIIGAMDDERKDVITRSRPANVGEAERTTDCGASTSSPHVFTFR
jgi:hypothetical protein